MYLGPYTLFDIIDTGEGELLQVTEIIFDIEARLNHTLNSKAACVAVSKGVKFSEVLPPIVPLIPEIDLIKVIRQIYTNIESDKFLF